MSTRSRARLAWLLICANAVALAVVLAFATSVGDVAAVPLIITFAGVGGMLVIKQPDNTIAWLLLSIGTAWSLVFMLPFEGGWVVPLGLMGTQLMLRFPTGSLPSSRWRWFSIATVALIIVLAFAISTAEPLTESGDGENPYYLTWAKSLTPLLLLFPVSILVSTASLVVRYRRAGLVEREQIRWLAWAAGTVATIYTVTLLASINTSWTNDTTTVIGLLQTLSLLSFFLIPVSIGIAVLKYRLYEIDRLISRTASYFIVTGLILATYAVVVALISRLLPDSSAFATAVATLTGAAAFRPMLRRVRTFVDKRFNRERFNAEQTVDAFARELRDMVDAEAVSDVLLTTVETTLQPRRAVLWLSDDARASPA